MENLRIPSVNNITSCERDQRLVHIPDASVQKLSVPPISVDDKSTEGHGFGQSSTQAAGKGLSGTSAALGATSGSTVDLTTDSTAPPPSQPWQAMRYLHNWLLAKAADSSPAAPPPFAWRPTDQTVAVCDSGDCVHVMGLGTAGREGAAGWKLKQILSHDLQTRVGAVAWRPVLRNMLAVGCERGVCLWTLGKAPIGNGGLFAAGGDQGAWMTFLRTRQSSPARCTSLAFSPDGMLLATASEGVSGITVWDVALGVGCPAGCGAAAFTMLRWSPDGCYLFAAGLDHHFYLWETDRWTCQRFDMARGDRVLAASWAPSSRTLLLAQRMCASLRSLHLIGEAPSLSTQTYDLPLPEVWAADRVDDLTGDTPVTPHVLDMAWDPSGTRLVVAVGSPHPAAGLFALYSTTGASAQGTVLHANFIGYIRPPVPQDARYEQPTLQFAHKTSGKGALLTIRLSPSLLYNVPLGL